MDFLNPQSICFSKQSLEFLLNKCVIIELADSNSVAKISLTIIFTDRSCVLYRDSFRITSNRRTCTHCREYICAFTSNYVGRGNPVRRHAASSREDQRTRRHSVLLHSLVALDVYNATFGVATPKRRVNQGERKGSSLRDFGETLGAFQQTYRC